MPGTERYFCTIAFKNLMCSNSVGDDEGGTWKDSVKKRSPGTV